MDKTLYSHLSRWIKRHLVPENTAVLMGALMIQGLNSGASLFTSEGLTTYTFFFGLLFANVFLIVITMLLARFFVKITTVKVEILIPIIISLCCIGTYALNYT